MNKGRISRGKSIINNSAMGLLSQGTTLLFTFLSRTLFIQYIGAELLGINGTFVSILAMLALSELGFHSAVAYNLYRPIHERNVSRINSVMNVFRLIYKAVGCFFIAASLLITPFLQYLLKGIDITHNIYLFFVLQMLASACSYFFAYKRTLLYADQHEYVAKTIDLVVNVIINTAQCFSIAFFQNYFIFLLLKIAQVIASNCIVHIYCTRKYKYLHREPLDKSILSDVLRDAKNIFAGKIASLAYSSAGNLIISASLGTLAVTWYGNYTTILIGIRNLTNSVLNPIAPIIGNYLQESEDDGARSRVIDVYTFLRYMLALVIVIPMVTLINEFIAIWIGREFILSRSVSILIGFDLYIHLVHGAMMDFILGSGLFKVERNNEVLGAVINVVTSLLFVQIWGIVGVLFGIVVSQVFFWISRSWVVYHYCLHKSIKRYTQYWIRNIVCFVLFVCGLFFAEYLCRYVSIQNPLGNLIVSACLCEGSACIVIVALLCIYRYERVWIWQNVKKFMKRKS